MKPDVISWRFLRLAGRIALARNADTTVIGLDHVPPRGPVIVAARHYHHLFDGALLVAAIDRPTHVVAGLDWIANPLVHKAMTRLCAIARWPVVIRPEHPDRPHPIMAGERRAILRKGARDVAALLLEDRVVIVFPEGYPNVDPGFTPKRCDEMLPFEQGYLRLAMIAQRSGARTITVVPAGFEYERRGGGRWRITLRFGEPRHLAPGGETTGLAEQIEADVIRLSTPPAARNDI